MDWSSKEQYNNGNSKMNLAVDDDFDRTPDVLQRWDCRILDMDVARLMRQLLHPAPTKKFAIEDPEMADIFFSAPYSAFAVENFGYV